MVQSILKIDTFPNEIWYKIFRLINSFDTLSVLSDLNENFEKLIGYTTLRIDIFKQGYNISRFGPSKLSVKTKIVEIPQEYDSIEKIIVYAKREINKSRFKYSNVFVRIFDIDILVTDLPLLIPDKFKVKKNIYIHFQIFGDEIFHNKILSNLQKTTNYSMDSFEYQNIFPFVPFLSEKIHYNRIDKELFFESFTTESSLFEAYNSPDEINKNNVKNQLNSGFLEKGIKTSVEIIFLNNNYSIQNGYKYTDKNEINVVPFLNRIESFENEIIRSFYQLYRIISIHKCQNFSQIWRNKEKMMIFMSKLNSDETQRAIKFKSDKYLSKIRSKSLHPVVNFFKFLNNNPHLVRTIKVKLYFDEDKFQQLSNKRSMILHEFGEKLYESRNQFKIFARRLFNFAL
ncbi:hypothetical protein WICMUC_000056 [Wickerhamomyces mucosus]|uniref:F-box domain-containing protein n=1 Tax=Wickerhamomyces mucosus TaxID=1378264 RepID=A0A9P8TIL2_9ASCO|nr:hypothetical protein WICMUC_000056 [Wickerhamomyces mucosus]